MASSRPPARLAGSIAPPPTGQRPAPSVSPFATPRPSLRVPIALSWNSVGRPVALVTLLVGFALRVLRLGDANIWWDEGLAIWAVRKSWLGTTLWTAGDVHPPLYFWTLWPWTRLVGESEFASRFLTAAVGLLTVAIAIPLGRRLGGPWVGVLTGALLATARFHIWWSQELRMYALAGLALTGALLALVRWRATRSRAAWLAYVLAAAAGLYTIYLSAVMLVAHNLWVAGLILSDWRRGQPPWLPGPPRRFLIGWVTAQLAVVALFAPWLVLAVGRMSSWSVAEPVDFAFVVQLQATLLTLGISTDIQAVTGLVAMLTAVTLAGLLAVLRVPQQRAPAALLVLAVALPVLVIFALALPRGLFYNPRVEARYFLPFAPPFYILLAWGLASLRRWWRPVGILTLALVAAAWVWTLPQHYTDRYRRDDLQAMVQVLRAYSRPSDVVLLVSGNRYPVFLYYYERGLEQPPPVEQLPRNGLFLTADNIDSELRRATRGRDRVWLAWVNGPMQDPDARAQAWLRQNFRSALSYGFAHNSLTLFTHDGAPPPLVKDPSRLARRDLIVGELLGYDLPEHEYRPGDVVRLGLYWLGQPTEARVGLVPIGADTPTVLRPVRLPLGTSRVQVELPILHFMPPGAYHVHVTASATVATLGALHLAGTSSPGTPAIPLDARLGERITLTGMTITQDRRTDRTLRPGAPVHVDLFWAAESTPARDYTVFVHLLGEQFNPATNGPVWAGHDSPPADGAFPTSWWSAQTSLRDRHTLLISPDTPPGVYALEVGLYDATGQRLAVSGADADPGERRIVVRDIRVTGR